MHSCRYVATYGRKIERGNGKVRYKCPKIQRLVTPKIIERKKRRQAEKQKRWTRVCPSHAIVKGPKLPLVDFGPLLCSVGPLAMPSATLFTGQCTSQHCAADRLIMEFWAIAS